MTGCKIHVRPESIPWLQRIAEHVEFCDVRGPVERFRDIAADALDGYAFRSELADLTRRRLLKIVYHGFDDSRGRDPMRSSDQRLCGTSWSVDPSDKLIMTLFAARITRTKTSKDTPS